MKAYDKLVVLIEELEPLRFNEAVIRNLHRFLYYAILRNEYNEVPIFLVNDCIEDKKAVIDAIHNVLFRCGLISEGIADSSDISFNLDWCKKLETFNQMQIRVLHYSDLDNSVLGLLFPDIIHVDYDYKIATTLPFPVIIDLTIEEFIDLYTKYPQLLHMKGTSWFGREAEKSIAEKIITRLVYEYNITYDLDAKKFIEERDYVDDPLRAIHAYMHKNNAREMSTEDDLRQILYYDCGETLKVDFEGNLSLDSCSDIECVSQELIIKDNVSLGLSDEAEASECNDIYVPNGVFA